MLVFSGICPTYSQVHYVILLSFLRDLQTCTFFGNSVVYSIRKPMFPISQMYLCRPSWIFKMAAIKNVFF